MHEYNSTPPGWYPDPSDPSKLRYWSGTAWTDQTQVAALMPPATQTASHRPWWQRWLAIIPALIVIFPLGLVALWMRRGTGAMTKAVVTGVVALLVASVVFAPGDEPSVASTTGTNTPSPDQDSDPAAKSAQPAAPVKAVVPRLSGMSLTEARARLAAEGLATSITKQPSAKAAGTVLSQSRLQGTRLKPGSKITLVVAAPLPEVPYAVGMARGVAVNRIHAAGFEVKVQTRQTNSADPGQLIAQTPVGGQRARPGSTVTIIVASRPAAAPAPPAPVTNCTPGYSPCLVPASDYDCAGGGGNGPAYANGPIYVTGSDPYGLDADGDGVACESY